MFKSREKSYFIFCIIILNSYFPFKIKLIGLNFLSFYHIFQYFGKKFNLLFLVFSWPENAQATWESISTTFLMLEGTIRVEVIRFSTAKTKPNRKKHGSQRLVDQMTLLLWLTDLRWSWFRWRWIPVWWPRWRIPPGRVCPRGKTCWPNGRIRSGSGTWLKDQSEKDLEK